MFVELLRQSKALIHRDHGKHLSSVEKNSVKNPKMFWSYLIPPVINLYGSVSISNAFRDFFAGVFEDPQKPVIYKKKYNASSSISINHLTKIDIENKIADLNVTKGPGPNMIPSIIIKSCCSPLSRM
ncbi:hypothetical protein HHI36_001823, partial [Cryptolaemus montrouzieri]